MSLINALHYLELDQLSQKELEKYPLRRNLFHTIQKDAGKHFTGIIGPRGVGKTILLKQLRRESKHGLYLSVDTVRDNLFDLIKTLSQDFGKQQFFLDEIHAMPDIDSQLKKIYDFLDVKIYFSSSTALGMQSSAYDLSRRVRLFPMDLFSLREYIQFRHQIEYPPLSLNTILQENNLAEWMPALIYFEEYLQGGVLPYALHEPNPMPLLGNILQKVIHYDIPKIHPLQVTELDFIADTMKFIGRSKVDGVNYSTLANNLKITKYKSRQYIELLEKAFIVKQIFPAGSNVMKEPKIILSLPYRLLYRDYDESLGALREEFFVLALQSAGYELQYLKSTRGTKTPDYLLKDTENIIAEVGGPGKGRSQFKNVSTPKTVIFRHAAHISDGVRPLPLLGFLTKKRES
jgi:uncharacterized protein